MPLPCILKKTAVQCHAKCKATQNRCRNPAAFNTSVCRYHGARRPASIKRGKTHPNYQHGEETLEAKAERSKKLGELRELENIMHLLKMTTATRTLTASHCRREPLSQRRATIAVNIDPCA